VTFSITSTTSTATTPTPTATPYVGPDGLAVETGKFLGPTTSTRLGAIVRGIQCQPLAQLAYTAYAHLQVYVDGSSRALPGGIGMVTASPRATAHGFLFAATDCTYWLHTRAADGLIEVQSPVPRRFTLGDLFRIWNQPLGPKQVAANRGPVTAIVDGSTWRRSPAAIPLREHTEIELAVGTPVPKQQRTDWIASGL